ALLRFNSAVGRLDQALESNEDDLIARTQVEEILGKQADSPLTEDPTGMLTTYTWRGALRSHILSAYYSYGENPGLLRYEIGAPEAPDPLPRPAADDPRMQAAPTATADPAEAFPGDEPAEESEPVEETEPAEESEPAE